jgi:hypothetical protein
MPGAGGSNPSYSRRQRLGGSLFKVRPSKNQDPISKLHNTKRVGGGAQVAECLLSKSQALSLRV